MATVGHTLVGLSLGGLSSRADSRTGAWQYVWPGLMVLTAHLVDIVEWLVIVAAPGHFDSHFATNSPLVAAGITAVVWLGLFIARLRRPWFYVMVAAAVFSHLVLDHRFARILLADTYNRSTDMELPSIHDSVVAELWLYGLLLVFVGLVQASRQRGCPARGRAAAGVFGALAIFAAITRNPALWIPAYGLAGLHSLLLFRRRLEPRLLWSLVPLLPLVALLTVELWATHLHDQALALSKKGDYAGAAKMYERVLAVPTRSQKLVARIRLSRCQRRQGELAAAEATLLRAARVCDRGYWAQYLLAKLYVDPRVRETRFFRPNEAVRMLERLIDGASPARIKRYARQRLDDLRRGGSSRGNTEAAVPQMVLLEPLSASAQGRTVLDNLLKGRWAEHHESIGNWWRRLHWLASCGAAAANGTRGNRPGQSEHGQPAEPGRGHERCAVPIRL